MYIFTYSYIIYYIICIINIINTPEIISSASASPSPSPSHMTKANGDIQAVILVGPGDRLYPLVDESSINPINSNTNTNTNTNNNNNTTTTNNNTNTHTNSCTMTGSSSNPNISNSMSSSTNLTSTPSNSTSSTSNNYSKAMLPICNRPLIYYPLTWLIQSGIGGTITMKFIIHHPSL